MFYWNQSELLSVVSHRCGEMAAWWWAVTTVKRRNEGSGSMATWSIESGRKFAFFSLHFQMKDGQESSALVMATGAAPSQPHVSSQSHLVDRGSLTQSFRVPVEPVDSSSTRPCCYWVCNKCHRVSVSMVVMYHPRKFSLICFSILLKKHECFEGVGKRRCKMAADRKLCSWQDCVWILNMPQSTLSVHIRTHILL